MAASRWSPHRRALIHTEVPGTVAEILADEGQPVAAGGALLRLRNLELESAAAQAGADMHNASARATQASMSYTNLGRQSTNVSSPQSATAA